MAYNPTHGASSSGFQPTAEQSNFRFNDPPTTPTDPPPAYNETPPESQRPRPVTSPQLAQEAPPPPRTTTPPPTPPPRLNTPDSSTDPSVRQCRICFETHLPPYEPSPDSGRLVSPCTCTGSSRYVHTGCLQQWRKTSNNAFYQCPTCKYEYRLRRLTLSAFLRSTGLQFGITFTLLLMLVWVLGFMSGPILSGYVVGVDDIVPEGDGWLEHFARGLASLGLIGFLKVIYLLGPGSWWNLRQSGIMGGRDRAARIGWIVIAVGVINFFMWLWGVVGRQVHRRMEQFASDVMDVGEDGRERLSLRKEFVQWVTSSIAELRVKFREWVQQPHQQQTQ